MSNRNCISIKIHSVDNYTRNVNIQRVKVEMNTHVLSKRYFIPNSAIIQVSFENLGVYDPCEGRRPLRSKLESIVNQHYCALEENGKYFLVKRLNEYQL